MKKEDVVEVDIESFITKIYGSVKAFTEANNLRYYHTRRALKNKDNKGYRETIKQIGEIISCDSQKVKHIKDVRKEIKVSIIMDYNSISEFARVFKLSYSKLWRYLSGRSYTMPAELQEVFTNSGLLKNAT